jgi:hypothetical protein
MKLSFHNKLSEYEIQILIFLSHVAVRDLVFAKLSEKKYGGLINPEELIDLLKRFKIKIEDNKVTIGDN